MHYSSYPGNPGIGRSFALVVVAQQAVDEVGGGVERQFRSLAMRGVLDAGKHRRLERTEAVLLGGLDLPERAVLIAVALDDQDRHADVAERFGDVPVAEFRIEPWLAPRAERAVHVGVP